MLRLFPAPPLEIDLDADPVHDQVLAQCYRWPQHPAVRIAMISSLDGGCTIDGRSGGLGGPADQYLLTLQRDLADIVLVGAGTVATEGYRWDRLPGWRQRRRQRFGRSVQLPLAVVTSRPLPPDAEVFSGTGPVSSHQTSPAQAVADLYAQGYRRIHCEGGPRLAAALQQAGLVHDWTVAITGQFLGTQAQRLWPTPTGTGPLRLVTALTQDGYLFTRYRVVN